MYHKVRLDQGRSARKCFGKSPNLYLQKQELCLVICYPQELTVKPNISEMNPLIRLTLCREVVFHNILFFLIMLQKLIGKNKRNTCYWTQDS